ncbi:MAG: hypothetical protein BGO77_03105 [Caedibacter sp. 37-49]|nr:MAG: hypothetical protein BGO77_03105 [Caedibacter sp. 37-49]
MSDVGYQKLRELFKNLPNSKINNSKKETILAFGPCAIEEESIVTEIAENAAKAGATYLRGGAIKLRTRFGSFEGLGPSGWKVLHNVASKYNLKTVSEVTDHDDLTLAVKYLDILKIGARSMWNFRLLQECASTGLPVMLKRGLGATTYDWYSTAERLFAYGCKEVIMCERGLASIDSVSRNSIDLSTLAFLLEESPLPLWVDVSHTAGEPTVALNLIDICKLLRADGVIAEIHTNPAIAKCDAAQAIPTANLLSRACI